jgi:hypothetical protein
LRLAADEAIAEALTGLRRLQRFLGLVRRDL